MESKKGLTDPLARLERIIGLIKLVASARVETGKVTSPFGTEINGFKVSIGGVTDPSTIPRTYDDIEKILRGNNVSYVEREEKSERGTFKSYIIETE